MYISASWLISPLMGAALAFTFFSFLNKQIFYRRHPLAAAKRVIPVLVFFFGNVLTLYFISKGMRNFSVVPSVLQSTIASVSVGALASGLAYIYLQRLSTRHNPDPGVPTTPPQVEQSLHKALKHLNRAVESSSEELKFQLTLLSEEVSEVQNRLEEKAKESVDTREYQAVEGIFAYMQIMSACMMAFGHGANDVANAIGPLAAALTILNNQPVLETTTIPLEVLALGGAGIVVGLAMWGWRVIETIGKKITALTPSRGFSAEFGAATTILIASRMGLPISTTHTLVGAVLGVGLARGISALNMNTVRDIVSSWVITIPAGAGLSIVFFYLLEFAFSPFF